MIHYDDSNNGDSYDDDTEPKPLTTGYREDADGVYIAAPINPKSPIYVWYSEARKARRPNR